MSIKQAFFTALDGRVKFVRGRYNITSDPVFLAAFVASKKQNATVLDAGIGTGGAALCLLARMPDLQITGIDISEQILSECADNAALNGRDIELINADILTWRTNRTFDIVITNPPYFKGSARAGGMHHNADLYKWTAACLKRVRPLGQFYCIVDAAVLGDVIAAMHGRTGDIRIAPLFGAGKISSAERVLIAAKLGSRGGAKIYAPISMNDDKILRNGKCIMHNE